ncbi:MAG TPA: DNA repair protein RadC [Alphaproteobacteria bacterium]|nr:DNA repair protein RadC [Alphaproteobacteria bacterium]
MIEAGPDPLLDGFGLVAEPEEPGHAGHRARLRARFLKGGGDALPDYELLELLLFGAIPRIDVKPLAKALIRRFGSYGRVLSAQPAELSAAGLSERAVAEIKLVHASAVRLGREETLQRPVISSWSRLLDYLRSAMSHEPVEQFRLLFLDRKNALIADEIQARGTVDHAPAYPREIVKRSLELGATAIILVHNHPSGDPTPSKDDIAMTREIVKAAGALGIAVHDHIIVGRGEPASLKSMGLM